MLSAHLLHHIARTPRVHVLIVLGPRWETYHHFYDSPLGSHCARLLRAQGRLLPEKPWQTRAAS
eukprot:2570878-Pyramimonas_sp.AAC.1